MPSNIDAGKQKVVQRVAIHTESAFTTYAY
jgi:hypothetical protein